MEELRKLASRAARTSRLERWRCRPLIKALPHRNRDDMGSVSIVRTSEWAVDHRSLRAGLGSWGIDLNELHNLR